MRRGSGMMVVLAILVTASPGLPAEHPALPAPELAREIDRLIEARLRAEGLTPAPRAGDADFLRRAWLDVAGVIPPAATVSAFLADTSPGKRARVIDDLLASPRHGEHQADVWLRLLVERESANEPVPFPPLRAWLADRFNRNQPWDKLVHDLLTASGTQQDTAATTFFLASPAPEQLVDRISRVFMGVQLNCAQCHDHPFADWTQEQYWAMAGYFTSLRYQGLRPTIGMTSVRDEGAGNPYVRPESFRRVEPRVPRGESPTLDGPPRPAFVRWLAAAENPFFAQAMCNRVWAELTGRGLVEPVDNMIEEPSHPELLDLLTAQFKASGFDLKHLVRAIALSETYQRTAAGPRDAKEDPRLYRRMVVRALTPEQLFDSLRAVLGEQGRGAPARGRFAAVSPREAFIESFAADGPAAPTEYRAGIPQALRLMNASPVTARTTPLVREAAGKPAGEAVEWLFLTTLSRPPSPQEKERFAAVAASGREEGCAAIVWALVNCSEFTLNR